MTNNKVKRRDFVKTAGGMSGTLLAAGTNIRLILTERIGQTERAQTTQRQYKSKMHPLQIEKVIDERGRVVVETTGAVFTIYRSNPARIEISQKINGPRALCMMEWETSFADLSLDFHDDSDCVLYVPSLDFGFNIRIFGDSLLSVRAGKKVQVRTSGKWMPEYSYSEAGNLLFLDKLGGYGQYLIPSAPPYGGVFEEPIPGLTFSAQGWETYFELPGTMTMLACAAPPRPFEWRSSIEDRIVHHFIASKRANGTWDYYPSGEMIKEYARYGNILVLHVWQRGAGPFKGNEVGGRTDLYSKAAPWATWRYEPLDNIKLKQVVKTAQDLGMRVLPYTSPLFFPGNTQEFLRELKRLLEELGFDGVYFDGVSEKILEAYAIMKETRRLLGQGRLLYVHIPSPIIGSSYSRGKYIYCPFIDTYANFTLRAEHIENFDNKVLQYTISGYNISNTIGFVANYDYNLEFNRELIQKALDCHVRVPFWVGWDIYLEDRGKAVGKKYPRMSSVHEIMVKNYFPGLNRLREKYPAQ